MASRLLLMGLLACLSASCTTSPDAGAGDAGADPIAGDEVAQGADAQPSLGGTVSSIDGVLTVSFGPDWQAVDRFADLPGRGNDETYWTATLRNSDPPATILVRVGATTREQAQSWATCENARERPESEGLVVGRCEEETINGHEWLVIEQRGRGTTQFQWREAVADRVYWVIASYQSMNGRARRAVEKFLKTVRFAS